MGDQEAAILGLKRELKASREKARQLKEQVDGWRRVARTLRSLAGLDEERFNNLLRAESATE
jgi:hypothetical protein